VLNNLNLNKKEKRNYKEKIDQKLIDNNKLLIKEFVMWCEIFNKYKLKLPLFYNYSKSYKKIFDQIINILHEINKKIQMDTETFNKKIINFIYKYTSNYDFKEICKNCYNISRNFKK